MRSITMTIIGRDATPYYDLTFVIFISKTKCVYLFCISRFVFSYTLKLV